MTYPTDDELIRRGDALMACGMVSRNDEAAFVENLLKSLPAASQPADPATNAICRQQVKVKPLVWEYYESDPHKICRAWCDALSKEWIIWIDCPDVEAEKAGIEQWRNDTILAAIEPTSTLTLKIDTTDVRAMLDKAQADMQHLNTIAATIRVNALRHGCTHEQADNFVTGKADFVSWMAEKVQPAPVTLADALQVPEVRALIGLIPEVIASLDATRCNVSLSSDLRAALRAIGEGEA